MQSEQGKDLTRFSGGWNDKLSVYLGFQRTKDSELHFPPQSLSTMKTFPSRVS
jgi:hypothetical protein